MGTNYYAKINVCKVCHRSEKEVHLGKSSYGWAFTLQANGYKYYKNWEEMKEWLKGKEIIDEYGDKHEIEDFIIWVEKRKDIKDPEYVDYGSNFKIIDGYKFYDCIFS